jgi:hypothetical protein
MAYMCMQVVRILRTAGGSSFTNRALNRNVCLVTLAIGSLNIIDAAKEPVCCRLQPVE